MCPGLARPEVYETHLQKTVKTAQMRTSGFYLFRVVPARESASVLVFGRDAKARRGVRKFYSECWGGFRCALIGGHWPREA